MVRMLVLKVLVDWYREVFGINICFVCFVFENLDGNWGFKVIVGSRYCYDKLILFI